MTMTDLSFRLFSSCSLRHLACLLPLPLCLPDTEVFIEEAVDVSGSEDNAWLSATFRKDNRSIVWSLRAVKGAASTYQWRPFCGDSFFLFL